jgi:DNA-binding XRE family transcriptional regulator
MTTPCKKKVVSQTVFSYTYNMPQNIQVSEKELAALAKKYRMATGKNRAEAARELGVVRQSLIHAEDFPQKSMIKLRKRIIEKYSAYKVVGPVYLLAKR